MYVNWAPKDMNILWIDIVCLIEVKVYQKHGRCFSFMEHVFQVHINCATKDKHILLIDIMFLIKVNAIKTHSMSFLHLP